MLMHYILVGMSGFAGAISRFALSKALNKYESLPFGTMTVNLAGSFLLGIITGATVDEMIALLFGTGFLGAFTTFSTLKLELNTLFLKDKKMFMLYLIITYVGGIALAFFGYLIGGMV